MIRQIGIVLAICLPGCGGVINAGTAPSEFTSGSFSVNIVASSSCTTLADTGRTRNWTFLLTKTGSAVSATMQGWPETAAVISQTHMAGTATGSSLMLTGSIVDTVVGCSEPLCYRAEGTIAGTQSGNVITGTLNGVVAYEATTCTAADHKVTFTRL